VTLRGRIVDAAPVIYGRALNGKLHLGSRGDVALVIDTGFTGSLALPLAVARRLKRTFVAVDTYTLATGIELELPMYLGSVEIGPQHVNTWFIVGDALIGMEFLEQTCSHAHVDFESQSVELVLK
jgi:predicted aspartyl protease